MSTPTDRTPPFWQDEHCVDKIAHALLDVSAAQRERIIVGALNKALAARPDLTKPYIDPRILTFVAAILRRIDEMERSRGSA